jgi:Flp pilus assembly protein TadG
MLRPVEHRQRRRDAGSSAIELVLLTPLLIVIVFGIIQAALLWHAQHVVVAAAQQGARLARSDTNTAQVATTDPGADAATVRAETISYLHQLGADLIAAPTVNLTRTPGWVTVTVTGHAVSLLPGATLTVHATSRGPAEGFRP